MLKCQCNKTKCVLVTETGGTMPSVSKTVAGDPLVSTGAVCI